MKRHNNLLFVFLLILVSVFQTATAERPGFGFLYYDGTVVATVVPPAAKPTSGLDNLYAIPDQFAVVGVAPGDIDYHGGQWAFHSVTWNVASYPLTSEDEVLAAAAAGDVTITRVEENDFLCPVQPRIDNSMG